MKISLTADAKNRADRYKPFPRSSELLGIVTTEKEGALIKLKNGTFVHCRHSVPEPLDQMDVMRRIGMASIGKTMSDKKLAAVRKNALLGGRPTLKKTKRV